LRGEEGRRAVQRTASKGENGELASSSPKPGIARDLRTLRAPRLGVRRPSQALPGAMSSGAPGRCARTGSDPREVSDPVAGPYPRTTDRRSVDTTAPQRWARIVPWVQAPASAAAQRPRAVLMNRRRRRADRAHQPLFADQG
jgi:hypothetical protein